MASMTHSPVPSTGNMASKSRVSDNLRSSTNGICGVPLRALGRAQLGTKRREFSISAKVGKVKHDYPWPRDPDPNVKGGVLSHLSPFKPLQEKPKPVILDFEKPLVDLQKKIIDVQKMANETGMDFSDQIISLENKYQQALKDLYTHLSPFQRMTIARHPHRPTCLDHIFRITDKFVELHGDRAGYDDPAIVTGLGTINGRTYMFIGHQKGRNTKENIQRNFGMPTPHGYRKALRMMQYADHHGFPIVTLVDTPGAYADLESEMKGQGEAIARNIWAMFGMKVPIISIIIGEGGSGGALAIACANKMLMLENAVFYVASPEACAAILWKDSKAAPKAAEKLKITATELTKLQIADGVIPEPLGGAHTNPAWTSQQIKTAILEAMDELSKMDAETLLKHRSDKYQSIGIFEEGVPVDPMKMRSMKRSEVDIISKTKRLAELEAETVKLQQRILDASKSSAVFPETELEDMIEKLHLEVDYEYDTAAKALGLDQKISTLREEVAKAGNSSDQIEDLDIDLKKKVEQLEEEFKSKLPTAPNYSNLKFKLDALDNFRRQALKLRVNKRFNEIMDRPEVKQKIKTLKDEIAESGVSDIESNPELKEKVEHLRNELDSEFIAVLQSMGLNVVPSAVKEKLDAFDKEVKMKIDHVAGSSDLKDKILLLKAEIVKAGETPDEDSKSKIRTLDAEIRLAIKEATYTPELNEKYEKLKTEISELDGQLVSSFYLKDKMEFLKAEIEKGGEMPDEESDSKILPLDAEIRLAIKEETRGTPELRHKYEKLMAAISEGAISSTETQVSAVKAKLDAFVEELMKNDNVVSSSDLKEKIELLKDEIAKGGDTEDESKILSLDAEIWVAIKEATDTPELRNKYEKLMADVLEGAKSSTTY